MAETLIISNRRIPNALYFSGTEDLYQYLREVPEVKILVFVFWSWVVPKSLLGAYACYGFHTGPLLEGRGRGGSPILNLQRLGVKVTTLCVFEMTEELDGGTVRLAIPIRIDKLMKEIEDFVGCQIPGVVDYLTAPVTNIPERFSRKDLCATK